MILRIRTGSIVRRTLPRGVTPEIEAIARKLEALANQAVSAGDWGFALRPGHSDELLQFIWYPRADIASTPLHRDVFAAPTWLVGRRSRHSRYSRSSRFSHYIHFIRFVRYIRWWAAALVTVTARCLRQRKSTVVRGSKVRRALPVPMVPAGAGGGAVHTDACCCILRQVEPDEALLSRQEGGEGAGLLNFTQVSRR